MTTKADDLEAVRQIAETLEPFTDLDRERILRWVREKVGMAGATPTIVQASTGPGPISTPTSLQQMSQDIASFVAGKAPKSDVHFAAVVAYYYQFVAPAAERRPAITKEDLVDACRKADRKRPKRPAQVLVNGYHEGLLDRGERGQYRLNSVGENLVAMVLPGDGERAARKKGKPKRGRRSAKGRANQTGRR